MAVSRRHTIYAVQLNAALMQAITQNNIVTGTEVRGDPTSGEHRPRHRSVVAQKPSASFTSLAIASALDAAPFTGKDMSTVTGGVNFFAHKLADGATRSAGSTHRKYNVVKGILFPTVLSCGHQGDASIAYQAAIVHDGSANDPVIITDTEPLPGTLADSQRFTLGPVSIGGVSLGDHLQSLEINFGHSVETKGAKSDIWDTYAAINTTIMRLTFDSIDVELVKAANIPFSAKAATHANTLIYLRKRAHGGTFVPNGTAEHISITAAGIVYADPAFEASGTEAAKTKVMLDVSYDGTNEQLVFDTTAAIS